MGNIYGDDDYQFVSGKKTIHGVDKKQRRELWKPRELKYTKGALGLYVKHAVSPMKGGYME